MCGERVYGGKNFKLVVGSIETKRISFESQSVLYRHREIFQLVFCIIKSLCRISFFI